MILISFLKILTILIFLLFTKRENIYIYTYIYFYLQIEVELLLVVDTWLGCLKMWIGLGHTWIQIQRQEKDGTDFLKIIDQITWGHTHRRLRKYIHMPRIKVAPIRFQYYVGPIIGGTVLASFVSQSFSQSGRQAGKGKTAPLGTALPREQVHLTRVSLNPPAPTPPLFSFCLRFYCLAYIIIITALYSFKSLVYMNMLFNQYLTRHPWLHLIFPSLQIYSQ